jgi:hypothetical protein
MFVTFSLYLYSKFDDSHSSQDLAWMFWCCVSLGLSLLTVSSFSFIAIVHSGCRCMMWVSCRLAVILGIISCAFGAATFILKKKFYNYLDNEGAEDGITSSDAQTIKQWYLVIGCCMMGVTALELLRFQLSRGFKEQSQRMDGEFGSLLLEDEDEWQNELKNNSATRADKYNDLRAHYKNKYANFSSNGKGGSSNISAL